MTTKPLAIAVLAHAKETKNMHKYDEIDPLTRQPVERAGIVNNLYLAKSVMGGKPAPKFIKLNIEEIE